ncbi:MAG: hypothetical protein FD121_367 [Gallionellaceae bacterium]|nr:MAG: hypothetical protein FD121_367 [Gallionellaceae bacterium]
MTDNHISRPALRVSQPLGQFFVFTLDADTLNKITFSQPAEIRKRFEQEYAEKDRGYSFFGSQRLESKSRLKEIAKFIESTDATFPNSIILAANYDQEGVLIPNDSQECWKYSEANGHYNLEIPLNYRSASIIDGQHRLHAFDQLSDDSPRRNMELLCVVFLELPSPYHAYIFATINFNQKKVDRSLAYELFGFNPDLKTSQFWPPETLAVYLARVLNTDPKSPLRRCIGLAAEADELFKSEMEHDSDNEKTNVEVRVSMAAVVDGILSLICKKPKEDRYLMRSVENAEMGRSALLPIDDLPLRVFYLSNNDKAIYDILNNYWAAVQSTIWSKSQANSYLLKTVGIQAQFDVLKILLKKLPITLVNYSEKNLQEILSGATILAQTGTTYQASGIGRGKIKEDLLQAIAEKLEQAIQVNPQR